MIPALRNQHNILLNGVYQSMAIVYPSGPEAGQLMLQRFRFADARKWIALNLPDELIDALKNGAIGCLPINIVFPPPRRKFNHLASVA